MATKKDFTSHLQDAITEATAAEVEEVQEVQATQDKPKTHKARKTYTAQEAQEFLGSMKTNGRKGVKLPRINLAFAPDVYEYCRTMARAAGMNYTEFVNTVLRQHMDEHAGAYKKAVEFRKSIEEEQ